MTEKLYNYKAIVTKITDGDTIWVTMDLGFDTFRTTVCRFYGINTPELKSKDPVVKQKAYEAKQFVADRLTIGSVIFVHSKEKDNFGRAIADIFYGESFEKHINQELIDAGLAVVYMA